MNHLLNDSFSKENNIVAVQFDINDAYDCAEEAVKVNEFYSEPQDSTQRQVINAKDFTASDLELFVDSMETIERLEKAKYERRQKVEVKQLQKSLEEAKKTVTCWDSTMSFISYDEDSNTESSFYIEEKTLHSLPCNAILFKTNETAFLPLKPPESEDTAAFCNNSRVNQISNCETGKQPLYLEPYEISHSGNKHAYLQKSDDYGIYFNNNDIFHVYEEIDPVCSRSNVIRQPNRKPLNSYHLRPALPPLTNIPSFKSFRKNASCNNIYERILNDVPQSNKRSKTAKKHNRLMKKKRTNSSSNKKFLNKAMRFLSLER